MLVLSAMFSIIERLVVSAMLVLSAASSVMVKSGRMLSVDVVLAEVSTVGCLN